MYFPKFIIFLAALATASPVANLSPVPIDEAAELALAELLGAPVTDITEISSSNELETRNDLEVRKVGTTPWAECDCYSSQFISDEEYSLVYKKTLADPRNNWSNPPTLPPNHVFSYYGPNKNFLHIFNKGSVNQKFSKSRVANIIHQLKVARSLKGCGNRAVNCWTSGSNKIRATVFPYWL
ncbi:hypothetical protein BJY04DRAFT_213618 [Aspergillus karnatakaensis]|uniref:uncharacterized protein n=1 Tax=Aspergillus karnatakaensis TaxID=1810916 RepID=UPI003CCDE839